MRFSAEDLRRVLRAVATLRDVNAHRHDRDYAIDTLLDEVPEIVDAYATSVGIELP